VILTYNYIFHLITPLCGTNILFRHGAFFAFIKFVRDILIVRQTDTTRDNPPRPYIPLHPWHPPVSWQSRMSDGDILATEKTRLDSIWFQLSWRLSWVALPSGYWSGVCCPVKPLGTPISGFFGYHVIHHFAAAAAAASCSHSIQGCPIDPPRLFGPSPSRTHANFTLTNCNFSINSNHLSLTQIAFKLHRQTHTCWMGWVVECGGGLIALGHIIVVAATKQHSQRKFQNQLIAIFKWSCAKWDQITRGRMWTGKCENILYTVFKYSD